MKRSRDRPGPGSGAALIAAFTVALGGCGDDLPPTGPDFAPTGVLQLSPGNASGKDEDPGILRVPDGSFLAAWLSDRDGNDELYVARSTDGVEWTDPARVTTHPDADWYPTPVLDEGGTFHLFWMRQQTAAPFARHVWTNHSADGVSWDPANEIQVTAGLVDDFTPHAVAFDGALLVYFDSLQRSSNGTRDLFVTRSDDGGATWSPPVALDDVNDPMEMDTFPYVMPNVLGGLSMVWVRYDASASGPTPYFHETSDVFTSASPDGVSWSAPVAVTANDAGQIVDSIPSLYWTGEDIYSVWTSNLTNPAQGDIVELAFSQRDQYPAALINVTASNQAPGWSARVVPTFRGGRFLRVWVSTISGSAKVHCQIFER